MKSKTAFLYGRGDLRIEEVEVPKLNPDQALVQTGACGIWGNGGYIDASDTAIILGAGPVGLSALMTAKASGVRTIAVDPLQNRRSVALKYGADQVVDPTAAPLEEQIMDLTGDRGGSVVVEASGNDEAIASLFDIAGHSARVRLIGHSVGR